MRFKPFVGLAFSVLLIFIANPVLPQAAPAAKVAKAPMAVGAGVSAFHPDLGHGPLWGGTLWIDYVLPHMPWYLDGIGLEVEARDLSLFRTASQSPNLREDTVEGGMIYSLRYSHRYRPFVKALWGYGNTDYQGHNGIRYHDSRTINMVGGGLEVLASHNIWVRADYEYQFWPDFFKATKPPGKLTPQGITVGAVYRFNLFKSK